MYRILTDELALDKVEAQLLVARIGRHADPQSFQLLAGLERGFES